MIFLHLRSHVRRLRSGKRCDHCGRGPNWGEAWTSTGGDKVWHDVCRSYLHWRAKAEERLAILDLVTDVWQVQAQDVYALAEGRAATGEPDVAVRGRTSAEADAWNRAWRVFYDLGNARASQEVSQ